MKEASKRTIKQMTEKEKRILASKTYGCTSGSYYNDCFRNRLVEMPDGFAIMADSRNYDDIHVKWESLNKLQKQYLEREGILNTPLSKDKDDKGYYCPDCKGTSPTSTTCENPCCPQMPCCGRPREICDCK